MWIPIINCGLKAGECPRAFEEEDIVGFETEEECENWIEENEEYFTPTEFGGCIYAYNTEE